MPSRPDRAEESLGISRWRGRAPLHCSWSRARWVHLAPWPDGKEAVPRDLITGGEMLRCELPNYESPGHTCSLEAHQCYRYWKIILAANLSSDEFHQGYKCRKRSLGFLLKKKKKITEPLDNSYKTPLESWFQARSPCQFCKGDNECTRGESFQSSDLRQKTTQMMVY